MLYHKTTNLKVYDMQPIKIDYFLEYKLKKFFNKSERVE